MLRASVLWLLCFALTLIGAGPLQVCDAGERHGFGQPGGRSVWGYYGLRVDEWTP